MNIEGLIYRFILKTKQKPCHVNDLLDFTQKEYIAGKMLKEDYIDLLHELHLRGAKKA